VQGAACNFGNSECSNGTTQCQSGAPVCSFVSHKPAGTGCAGGTGVCNGAGACVPCAQGAVCNAGECVEGRIQCNTGGPVCNAAGMRPLNTPCSNGGRCNGQGTCGRCGDGVIDTILGEQCDSADRTRCSASCQMVCNVPNTRGTYADASTGRCYWRTSSDNFRGREAENVCAANGGFAARLETTAEKSRVYEALIRNSSTSICWIGLQRGGDGVYRWGNGVPLSYDPPWRGGVGQTCVTWRHDNGTAGRFQGEGCDGDRRDIVCERDPQGIVAPNR
jgi:hypothetical protein